MPENKDKIKKLENQQKDTDKRVGHIIGILEGHTDLWRDNAKMWKSNDELWKENTEIWMKFLKNFRWIIILVFIAIAIHPLLEIFTRIWAVLSENWRIAFFGAIWTLLVALVVLFIDRKYFKKPTNSKTTQNSKKGDINKN